MTAIPLLPLLIYGFCLWFGCYLLIRNFAKPAMRYAGAGLISYALGLAFMTLLETARTDLHALALMLPALLWFGAIIHLVPGTSINWRLLVLLLLAITGLAILLTGFNGISAIPVTVSSYALWIRYQNLRHQSRRPFVILLTATLFFALGSVLLILPVQWFKSDLILMAVGFDLALLGYAVAMLDAYDEGEVFRVDFLQSLLTAFVAAVIFGGQVAVLMVAIPDESGSLQALLVAIVSTAILLTVGFPALQAWIDHLVLGSHNPIQRERAELRAVANAIAKQDDTLNLESLDDDEFSRLTRRALSHMSDLSRLAASPLLRLPEVDQQLEAQHDSTLARAAALKQILTERIDKLKPQGKGEFGTSDEWRFYNALYFPYVLGVKPYSRRTIHDHNDPTLDEALDWFQTYVPERTLHNWQNAAARLIAQDLRETQPNWQ